VAEPSRMALPGKLRAWPDRIRRRPARGLDIAITVAITAATVGPVLIARVVGRCAGRAGLRAGAVAARAPVRVTAVVGLAMTALVIGGHHPLLPYGPLAGVYTIAAVSASRVRLSTLPVIAAAVYVSLVGHHHRRHGRRPGNRGVVGALGSLVSGGGVRSPGAAHPVSRPWRSTPCRRGTTVPTSGLSGPIYSADPSRTQGADLPRGYELAPSRQAAGAWRPPDC
jgi:hypothetical protein